MTAYSHSLHLLVAFRPTHICMQPTVTDSHVLSSAPMKKIYGKLECGPMPNMMAALTNIGGALCSTPLSLADSHYYSAVHNNAAKTRNPLKYDGVPQTRQSISAVSGPKFTIL